MEKAEIRDGRPRNVVWINDMLGQGVRRDEADNQVSGDPHEIWHRFSGRQMGYVGYSVASNVNYSQSNGARVYGANPAANADFDLAYDHITTYEQGSMGGAYTVRAGDTLSSIASALWGDASLWYKIAEANGLTGGSALNEGAQVTKVTDDSRNPSIDRYKRTPPPPHVSYETHGLIS